MQVNSKSLLMLGKKKYTLTVVLSPGDATCTLTYDGVAHTAISATVNSGTIISYSITKSPYGTTTGTITMDANKTLTATGTTIITPVAFSQPYLTSNGTLGGNSFAVASSSGNYPYYAFDSNAQHYYQSGNATYAPHYIIVYNPDALKLSSVQFNLYSQNANSAQKDMSIYGSNTNGNWTLLYSDNVNYATAGTNTATYLVNATSYYKYLKFQTSGTNQGSWVVRKIYLTAYTASYSYGWNITIT